MALVEPVPSGRGPWVWPRYTNESTQRTIPALLWTLAELGGVIESASGRAGSELATEAAKRGMPIAPRTNLTATFRELDSGRYGGTIAREHDGKAKRTYKITLLLKPDEMPPKPAVKKAHQVPPAQPTVKPNFTDTRPPKQTSVFVQAAPALVAEAVAEPEPAPEVTPTVPPLVVVDDTEPLDLALDVADGIARVIAALLVQNAEARGEAAPDAEEQALRLAQTIEENNRLRRKVNEQAETIRAKTKEAEGLRKAWQLSETNLKTLRETVANGGDRERNVSRLDRNSRFIAQRPEPAIMGRRS